MKKITLILGLLVSSFFAFSQSTPCPDIQSYGATTVSSNGTNCTFSFYVYATGDVQSPKGLSIAVYNGPVAPANLVSSNCFIVPKSSPSSLYTTSNFTVPCSAGLTFVITRYTASNGQCQGGTCGQTITIDGGPLPINMTNFFVKREKGNAAITWKTSFEQNAKEFVIQRKTGNDFETIATVPAANVANGYTYSYNDPNNVKGISQYRIKMVDADGAFKYTEIRSIKGTSTVSDFNIFPNPSTGSARVSVSDVTEDTDVQVVDNSGRILKTYQMGTGNTVDIANLQKGMYMIRVVTKSTGEAVTKKLTVIN